MAPRERGADARPPYPNHPHIASVAATALARPSRCDLPIGKDCAPDPEASMEWVGGPVAQ